MTRRRRALLLVGLALLLGGLAASDVARREAALHREVGPLVPVVVARAALPRGTALSPARLVVRRIPGRFVPAGAVAAAGELTGLRTAIAIPAGGLIAGTAVDDGREAAPGPPIRPGERVAEVTAVASPELVVPGSRVDVLVSREGQEGGQGRTLLALEDVDVLASRPAAAAAAGDTAAGGAPRVVASLRVTVRQAVFLAAAQSFAREIRLLPRAAGDRRRGEEGLEVSEALP